jgi:RNase P protein component
LKRRLREVGRTEVLPRLHADGVEMDIMFRARREAYDARFSELKEQMVKATESACSVHSFSG